MIFRTIVFGVLIGTLTHQFSYNSFKVYRIQPFGDQYLDVLKSLSNNNHFDFWSPLKRNEGPIDVMVDPSAQEIFEELLERSQIIYRILINNVESVIQKERIWHLNSAPTIKGRISFTKYHRHEEINAYLNRLAQDHANIVSIENIGKSYEGRDLKLIKISTNTNINKPIIFIDAAVHAREWIAPTVPLYAINQLIENSGNLQLLDKIDLHILPVVNPDGYEYTHLVERLWRKTRSPGTVCNGTDGNRNYDFHWGEKPGASSNECSINYQGKRGFSEPEISAIRDYVLRNKDRIKLYLTFHSYGKLILYPWGYTSELPENSDELQTLGELAAKSIESVAGTSYKIGTFANALYSGSGISTDWVKGVGGVELAYTVELPGGGSAGFDLPPSEILPVVTETWEGIKTFILYISKKFG